MANVTQERDASAPGHELALQNEHKGIVINRGQIDDLGIAPVGKAIIQPCQDCMVFGQALSKALSNWNIRMFNGCLGGKRNITVLHESDALVASGPVPAESLIISTSAEGAEGAEGAAGDQDDAPPFVLDDTAGAGTLGDEGPPVDLDND